jgi:hypothetical protein
MENLGRFVVSGCRSVLYELDHASHDHRAGVRLSSDGGMAEDAWI